MSLTIVKESLSLCDQSSDNRQMTALAISSRVIVPPSRVSVLVAGGGLLGLSLAASLSRHLPSQSVALVERRPTLLGETSDASTGGFRNFYPDSPSMTALSNLSLDGLVTLNETNDLELVQNGYSFFSTLPLASPTTSLTQKTKKENHFYWESAQKASKNGTGPLRLNPSFMEEMIPSNGIDLFTNPQVIQSLYPTVSNNVQSLMRVNRAGYVNVQLLGIGETLYKECIKNQVEFIQGTIEDVCTANDRTKEIQGVSIRDSAGILHRLSTTKLVLALGPNLKDFGKTRLGLDIPVKNELHARIQVEDPQRLVPEKSPFLIWSDDIDLPWTKAEKEKLKTSPRLSKLLQTFKVPGMAGAHLRPLSTKESNGTPSFFGIWTYDNSELTETPLDPPPNPELYAPVVLRGLSQMIPNLKTYFPRDDGDPLSFCTNVTVKSGYYCKTLDNTPLLGPLKSHKGLFICGGVSGFGVMCSQGAAQIVAGQMIATLDSNRSGLVPEIASLFDPHRFDGTVDSEFVESLARTANQL